MEDLSGQVVDRIGRLKIRHLSGVVKETEGELALRILEAFDLDSSVPALKPLLSSWAVSSRWGVSDEVANREAVLRFLRLHWNEECKSVTTVRGDTCGGSAEPDEIEGGHRIRGTCDGNRGIVRVPARDPVLPLRLLVTKGD